MPSGFVFLLIALFGVHQYATYPTQRDKNLPINDQVQEYLDALDSTNWLENSNKIGIGYNPLYGTPVCYTGSCQMEGFGRSIFKLNYLRPKPGTCTQKLIPENVDLDCLPSTTWDANTESISTLHELHESITNKVDAAGSGTYSTASFSYKTSVQTRYMVDNIVKKNTTTMQTTAQISYVKLSMFEPTMELSDPFKYVINNLPCCNYDADTEEYIYDYILNYFGYTYLSTILLGGIAQENVLINTESYQKMQANGLDIVNEAKAEFFITMGAKQQYTYNKNTHDEFMTRVQEKHVTTLGGDTSLTSIEQWSKTVPSNPVIIKFSLQSIFNLLNQVRFPNDSLIQNKSVLIAHALHNYLNDPAYCYNNCTGHGTCVPSPYFQFGICNCTERYSGVDCSIPKLIPASQITSRPAASSGTICVLYSVQFVILLFSTFVFI
ncbi:unnamed protein product [Rotaria sp. Silwood2]|nr:unnamed protein product [Rotaria sp. Silwood2]CAF4751479.1 unnamed protein product [Rotaria sp. Silwood2]